MRGLAKLRWKRLVLCVAGLSAWCLLMAGWQAAEERRLANTGDRWRAYQARLKDNDLPQFGPWSQVGPFAPNLRHQQRPETNPAADEAYPLFRGGTGTWQSEPAYLDGYVNVVSTGEIDDEILELQPTVYLTRIVTSPRKTTLKLFLGCDGGFTLWQNGQLVTFVASTSGFQPGREVALLPLDVGENRLLLKIKLAKSPCRFFIMPDFGAERSDRILGELEHGFPSGREPVKDYRRRAALESTDAEQNYYPMVDIPAPAGVYIEGGGLDFLSDGRLAVSTRRGFVYLVENPGHADPSQARFHRFAGGLHEGFGLKVVDGQVLVVERGGLTRLLDTDNDGRADRFENLYNQWGLTGAYHEYAYGLEQDELGNLYVALNTSSLLGPMDERASPVPYRGWVVRITPEKEMEPFCYGFRSPNGMGRNAQGDLFVTDNQGQFVPASPLYHIRQDHYYGHPASIRWAKDADSEQLPSPADRPPTPPAVWMPYEDLSMSATDVVCDETGGRFGPFGEQLFVGDMTKGTIIRVALERVAGEYQGACFLFRRGCGAVNRMTFGPDGNLYFARVNRGWGGGGRGEGLGRIEFTGQIPLEVLNVTLQPDGFLLQFTKPLDPDAALDRSQIQLEQFGYHHWRTYGSPKIHRERLAVHDILVSAEGTRLRIRTAGLKPSRICRITLPRLQSADGDHLLHVDSFYTINALR